MRHAIPKNDAAKPTFVRCLRPWKRPEHHDRRRRTKKRTNGNKKRKQNADRRGSPCFTLRRSAHPGQGALACRRSTAALARETAGPQGSASGHAFRDSPERSVRYGRPNRGAETLRVSTGVTRAETNPSAASTSRAGRCAGRLMPDAARVQRGRTLRPRAPHPLPPAIRHRLASLHEERGGGASSRRAGRVKPNHRCMDLFDPTRFLLGHLLQPVPERGEFARIKESSRGERARVLRRRIEPLGSVLISFSLIFEHNCRGTAENSIGPD